MISAPAFGAEEDETPHLVRCTKSITSIALVQGDQAGWSEWGPGSPRALLNALVAESGCFTIDNPNDNAPARFLVTAIAGSADEVDKGIELAKGAAAETLVRSGAATQLPGSLPGAGALIGMFGGLGGKKETVVAGLRVVSPANGLPVAAEQGVVKKSTINFGNASYGWAGAAANASGCQGSKNGKMLTEAFVLAFNDLVAQRELMSGAPEAVSAAKPGAAVAFASVMRASLSAEAEAVRNLRAAATLDPTGKRDGLFIKVKDRFGSTG